jgi:acyl dehydratase
MIEWFDDLAVGMRFRSSEKVVTRDDIKRFAAEFDPQPYHLDEAAAQRTPLKGLAASGWHTAAIAMRLAVEIRPFGPHPLLGLGVDDLRWLAPVRPGDALHLEGEVIELTPSKTKPKESLGSNGQRSIKMERPCTRSLQSPSCRVAPLDRPRSIGWRWRDRACANAAHPLPLWMRNRRGQVHRQHQFRPDALIGCRMRRLNRADGN